MWKIPKISSTADKDEDDISTLKQTNSINEEYFHAFTTQSYVDFFAKAQQLTKSSTLLEILLLPDQNLIPSLLEQNSSCLKPVLLNFFNTSAQASELCSKLLTSINEAQANNQLIQSALQRFSFHSSQQYNSAILELDSFSLLKNPFSHPDLNEFKSICEEFSTILDCLKSKRKKVARRMKFMEFLKKTTGVCLAVACSVAAMEAIGIAIHSFTGFLIGPAPFGLLPFGLRFKISKFKYLKCRSLRKLRRELDVTAKGTYILNRDLDTICRIVARLQDELEHEKEMIKFCLERKNDKFSLHEVFKELRKDGSGFKWQVEELEEHVCLCLVTVHRVRASVIKEMGNTWVME